MELEAKAGVGPRLRAATVVSWGVLAIALVPTATYFWYVHRFGVGVPYLDGWLVVPRLESITSGHLTLAQLWAPHNEERLLFPYLILLPLYLATGLNTVAAMYASGVALLLTVIAIGALSVRGGGLGGWWLLPVPFILFSLGATQDILWGWQFAWYLVLLAAVIALMSLQRSHGGDWWYVVAVLAALVASYSSLQGLLIWPAGVLFGLGIGLRRSRILLWAVIGVGAIALYLYNFGPLEPHHWDLYALSHPIAAADFLVLVVGDFVPSSNFRFGGLVLLAALLLFILWLRPSLRRSLSAPLALVVFGLGFDVLVTIGRVHFGTAYASETRFQLYSLLTLVGLYLGFATWLRREWRARGGRPGMSTPLVLSVAALTLLVGIVGYSIATTLPARLSEGMATRARRLEEAPLLTSIRTAPLAAYYPWAYTFTSAQFRNMTEYLAREHWSVFAVPPPGH